MVVVALTIAVLGRRVTTIIVAAIIGGRVRLAIDAVKLSARGRRSREVKVAAGDIVICGGVGGGIVWIRWDAGHSG